MATPVPLGVLISPIYPPDADDVNKFSHLGGLPSLPQGLEWPRATNGAALHFLAQIDLTTLPANGVVDFCGDPLPEFPREGALYFFADCATFGLWEQPDAAHRVVYAPNCRRTRPVQLPNDLALHNAPESVVLANTHHPHTPSLRPRPMVLLPRVPISLSDISSVLDLPSGDPPRPLYLDAPWTGYEIHGDWSRMALFDTGFPWRWLLLERIAISVHNCGVRLKGDQMRSWPQDIQAACISWAERASAENSLDKIPEAIADEFRSWLQGLATRDQTVRYHSGLSIDEAMIAAWPYIAFGGDLSDLPSELVQDLRPLDRPTTSSHHKILGDAVSVQGEHLADENNILLLRLESDYPLDFCWGDMGVLQITISRDDLIERNFQHTSLNADCH